MLNISRFMSFPFAVIARLYDPSVLSMSPDFQSDAGCLANCRTLVAGKQDEVEGVPGWQNGPPGENGDLVNWYCGIVR